MREVMVLAEHRRGEMRDITREMLAKGRELAEAQGDRLVALLLGSGVGGFAAELAPFAERVLVVESPELENFNSEAYQEVLRHVIRERRPRITLMGHTSYGIDLAPALAIDIGAPLAPDCIDLRIEDGGVRVTRQIYGGKINVEASLKEAEHHIVTVRPATFEPREPGPRGEIERLELPATLGPRRKAFLDYVEPPPGEVDISEAEIIVSVGRGIKDEKNLPLIAGLADALKGEVGCSRPIVDKYWLPKERQVGSSGKTVKPKLYLATGISGSFQHVMGMKASGLIVAINKDPKAPIFRIADYGVVDDLFKVVPALTQKINELRQSDG
jgi:electron transfer flavoprotein alpha subunit